MSCIPTVPPTACKIINDVLSDHRICAEDFYSNYRDGHLVEARKDAARRLKDTGRSVCAIGRILKRNHTTILFYLNEDYRAKKAKRGIDRRKNDRFLSVFPPDIRTWIEIEAKREGREPSAVVREIVRDVAEHAEMCAREAA